MPTPNNVKELIAKHGIKIVDLKFVDLPGTWQHFSMPIEELDTGLWEDGIGFDGSSIRGFQQIQESDMNLFLDTVDGRPGPGLRDPDALDPLRHLRPDDQGALHAATRATSAKKAEAYLKATGIADTSYWGPELEFFIFDDIRFDSTAEPELLLHRLGRGRVELRPRRKAQTWATSRATRKATSPSRRTTLSRTCAAR